MSFTLSTETCESARFGGQCVADVAPLAPKPSPRARPPSVSLSNTMPVRPTDRPRRAATPERYRKALTQALLDHRFPRHQRESSSIIKHRVAPTGEHDAAPKDAGHTLPLRHGPMLQAGVCGNVLRGLRQLAPAQRRQQIARENNALPAMLAQSLLGREVGALS